MSALTFRLYAAGLDGLTLENLTVGTTVHPLALAIPQEDPNDEDENVQVRGNWYQLLLPLSATVAINEAVTFPISDSIRFAGKVTSIETDIVRDCKWLIIRGKTEAVT